MNSLKYVIQESVGIDSMVSYYCATPLILTAKLFLVTSCHGTMYLLAADSTSIVSPCFIPLVSKDVSSIGHLCVCIHTASRIAGIPME